MEGENQRVALTKRLLKESILRLLREKELDKITVSELCRDAGINRATFYRHYSIPRDVLIELEKDLYFSLRREIPRPKSSEETRQSVGKLCYFLAENMEFLRISIQCNSDADFVRFINEVFGDLSSEIRDVPAFRGLDAEDIKMMTLYSCGGSYFLLRHWLMGTVHKSADEVAEYLYRLMNKTDWVAFSKRLGLLNEE